ncbi:dynamin-related protein 3A-like [Bidens hawaiensis]|uniref:dynamin-related protein 3A-like n=1 Tax=Bidens hawaiensis TaxID=980011 RepID=UPI00404B47ED
MAEEPLIPPTPHQPPPPNADAAPLGHNVIPIVNKLQDLFAQIGTSETLDLPQVAVVGSQSSGKSSVLEALVGRDFLPRGSDICTRRPLVLQLLQTQRKPDGTAEEYGEFLHVPKKRFYDFNEIRREIQAETDKEAGGNKGVSDKQIRLKIFSPNVLDITLVDLPGITKVPVGDQPSDIEARIRTMIMSYIKIPSCLILAVTPANSDLANSDALQIAGNADPDGYRTIGVITKLDIMDRGTDARNFLLGKVIPLRLGYVGVVNRSQEDIMLNRSIKDALVAEEKFFRSRPVYNEVADRCGVPALAKKLNQILVQHINTRLPGLKKRINSELCQVAKELASFGEITESKAGMGALLLNILSKDSEAFSSLIEGKNDEMSTSELSGGARIHHIFQSIFIKSLEEVDPCEDLTDEDIRTAIQNATGPKSALFVPEVPFEVLIRRQIARLLDPSIQCARFIYDELIKMSHRCMVNELQRFPVLRKRIDDVLGNFLREGLEPSVAIITHFVDMEV